MRNYKITRLFPGIKFGKNQFGSVWLEIGRKTFDIINNDPRRYRPLTVPVILQLEV